MLPRTKRWKVGKRGRGSEGTERDGTSLGELVEGIVRGREGEGRQEGRTKGRFYIKASQVRPEGLYHLPTQEKVTETSPLLQHVERVDSRIDLEAGLEGGVGSAEEEKKGWPWDQIIGTLAIVGFFATLFVLQRECGDGRSC